MGNVELNLDELLLDLTNPRFDGLANQRDALEKIAVSQGSKLVNLAEDIVANNMSPAHRMLVMRTPGKGLPTYTVMDGNRRVAALRILANPSVLDGMPAIGRTTAQKLRKLAKEFRLETVQPFDVFVCKNEAEARHWIEAIHTGQNDGRGVVEWDGIATARYRGKNTSLKVLDFVKAVGKLDDAVIAALERFPITNLDRLLGTPEIRERLGLTLEEGDLTSDLPQTELLPPLRKIVSDLALKKINVAGLKSKDDRLNYINSLGKALPDLSKRTGNPFPLDRLSISAQAQSHSKAGGTAKSRSLIDRKSLIPPHSQAPLNITDEKLQRMCRELRKLPLETYPIAVAACFRVFLELSLDHYGLSNRVVSYAEKNSLNVKLEHVASALEAGGMTKRDLQSFRRLGSSTQPALSIDRLNGVMHSRYTIPTASDLRSGWAEVQVVFCKIWE